MRSSGPISLFSERQQSSPPTASVILSIVVHATVIGLVALAILFRPRIANRDLARRYTVRHLDLHMPDPVLMHPKDLGIKYPSPEKHNDSPPAQASAHTAVARQVAQVTPAPQTLLQPKLPPQILPEKIPVPTVVLWSMENKPLSTIVPPLPSKPAPSVVQPAIDPPNLEVNLDKLAIASSQLASKTQPILPSTTSPVVTLAPQAPPAPAQTTSKTTEQPTPATIVSLSDVRKDGPVVLPAVNETASAASSGALGPGRPEDVAQADHGGAAKGDAPNGNKSDSPNGSARDQSAREGKFDVAVGQAAISAPGVTASSERIVLPKDGQFGSVIVGSTLEETYPEAAELWGGRLAYTVYIHVGLAKSWILQYSLPRTADAALGGNAAHLAAPWPYTIIRPNLALGDLNADALMVHGLVNAAGHFELLAVAFPPKFAQADFVIGALRQWEFRPATQGGQPATVEVLLIIPEESE
jgi:hypothetical protein